MNEADFLRLALEQARAAQAAGEVPVGAVLVYQGQVIAQGHNQCIAEHDATAHAEIQALRAAGRHLGNYRLSDCDLYVTLEPCAMCAGAMAHARLQRVVYGVRDARAGAAGSALDVLRDAGIPHTVLAQCAQDDEGLDAELRAELLQLLPDFFQGKRQAHRLRPWPLNPDALRAPDALFEKLVLPQGVKAHFLSMRGVASLRLHYWDTGLPASSAQRWIALHDAQHWSASFADFFEQERGRARVLALDLPGFGRSDKWKKTQGCSQVWYAQVFQDWWDDLCAEDPALSTAGLVLHHAQHPLLPALRRLCPGLFTQAPLVLGAPAPSAQDEWPYPDSGHRAAQRLWQEWQAEP